MFNDSVSVRRLWPVVLGVASLIVLRGSAQSQLPVVPGAFGFGMETRAAYGGGVPPAVLRVTNLNDSGPGSLRAALAATGPRVVIFETSGTIDLDGDLVIDHPYVTVAGQTAPSPGITLRNYGLWVYTHDVLLQHFRIRPGGHTCNSALVVYPYFGGPTYNVVIDHMSVSWGQDENMALAATGSQPDVTVWRSISAEGLDQTPGTEDCSGGGLSPSHGIGVAGPGASVIQTLMANNAERNPYIGSSTATVLINNVVYNWAVSEGFLWANVTSGGGNGGPWYATAVGNSFIGGPHTFKAAYGACAFSYSANFGSPPGNSIYRSDNRVIQGGASGEIEEECNYLSYNPNVGSAPSGAPMPHGAVPLASADVEALVLSNAGARPADRDGVDARIVQEVSSRTGTYVRSPHDVGGWPTLAINTRSLGLPANPHGATASGYTVLETWLHSHAAEVEGTAVSAAPHPPSGVRLVH